MVDSILLFSNCQTCAAKNFGTAHHATDPCIPLVSSHALPTQKKRQALFQFFKSWTPNQITTAFLFIIFPKCSRDSTQNGEDLCMNNGYQKNPKPWCKSHWSTSTEAACDIQAHSQLGERLKKVFGKASEFIIHGIHVWYIYLEEWLIFMVNVGKYTSPLDPMSYGNLTYVRPY